MSVLTGVDPSEDNFVSNGIGNQYSNHSHWMPAATIEPNREKVANKPPIIINIRRERQGTSDRGGGGREKWREERR